MIQPLVLERLPCYDFTPIIEPTFGRALLTVRLRTSGVPDSHGVTGGVYKARERIHRGMLYIQHLPAIICRTVYIRCKHYLHGFILLKTAFITQTYGFYSIAETGLLSMYFPR